MFLSSSYGDIYHMKVTLFSNYLNHHQLPFCLKMDELTNHQFTFVASTDVSDWRRNLGYQDMNKTYPFVLTTYDSEENYWKAMELCQTSDVVILGACPDIYLKERVKLKKLTFRYTERIHKLGPVSLFTPLSFKYRFQKLLGYEKAPTYILCAGSYVPYDLSNLGCYRNKTYQWGYFPELRHYEQTVIFQKKDENKVPELLWVARLISWKHPEAALHVASYLKEKGYSFHLNLIGTGEMEDQLKKEITQKDLADYVTLVGSVPSTQVRDYMERADIFLFTSDRNEGWGVVLNEAMNSCCACIASHEIGAAGSMIKHGENGLLYQSGNEDELCKQTEYLLENKQIRKELGWRGYCTITEEWNADVGAKRLLELSESLIKGTSVSFTSGPCSKAPVISPAQLYQSSHTKNHD